MPHEPSPILIRIAVLFNEIVMGALALVALATALGPMVFDVGPSLERTLTFVEWILVGMFAAEFVIQGLIAADRQTWIRSPWRIVDLVTILGPIAALMPQVSDVAGSSLMLRMLRLGRAVAFGTRAGSVAVRESRTGRHAWRGAQPVVTVVTAEDRAAPVASDWRTFLEWTKQPTSAWYHAANLSPDHFNELAKAAGISEQDISHVLNEQGIAKLRGDVLILQIPEVAQGRVVTVERDRVLAIVTRNRIFTATTGDVNLQQELRAVDDSESALTCSFPARVACTLLRLARDRNHAVNERFDEEARRLEALEGDRAFLRDTFRLRRELSAAALDVWHLKSIVRAVADGKATLGGVDLKKEKYVDDLLAGTESLHEVINAAKDNVKTLIELHINFKSFEMNAFLKVLAVVSFLGLIPSVIGGLLGMNVMGNPWSVTLPQVAFGIAMSMAVALYVFAVKGWLK